MAGPNLKDLHLADLHERAREAGIEGYRLLGREELIDAIENAADSPPPDDAPEAAEPRSSSGRRRRGRRGGRGRGRGRERDRDDGDRDRDRDRGDDDDEGDEERIEPGATDTEDVETEEVSGILDRMPQGFGFLRLSGLSAADGDVYVSASQIRRCELRPGDEVTGPAREPRRGERHRALVRVEAVNGQEPETKRPKFEGLTAEDPHRKLPVKDLDNDLAFGQRVLVVSEAASASDVVRAVGEAAAKEGARLRVLLDDERAEDAEDWGEAEVVAPPPDQEPNDQIRAAELAVGHAKRRVEAGEDIVLLIDTLSRLSLGYRDPTRVKRLFGAGRELSEEGSGSLTVVAVVIEGTDRADETLDILEGTEDVLVRVDADGNPAMEELD
jgi:transcription termination factor Rho